ncbi:MAG: hypothetical protein U0354_08165 [Candidatus Sericytochromatia bacterium]
MKIMVKSKLALVVLFIIANFLFFTNEVIAKEEEPQKVYVGLFLNNIANISLPENTFSADFYIWFKWKGKIDPSKTFEFSNSYENWGMTQTPAYEEPKILPDGHKYQIIRVQGKFICKFDLHAYPLDKHSLHIEIEDSQYHSKDMIYIPDNKETDFEKKPLVPGWRINNLSNNTFIYDYKSNFGDNSRNIEFEKYYRYRYSVEIERPKWLFLLKTIVPIFIVLVSVFTVFFIHPFYIEVRSGIIITALLSAVALQITASSDLGPVGYLVLIDKIYNISYVVTILALIETVVAIKYKDVGVLDKAIKLDKISFKVLGIMTLLSTILAVMTR